MLSSSAWRNMIPPFTSFCRLYSPMSSSPSLGMRLGSAPVTTSMVCSQSLKLNVLRRRIGLLTVPTSTASACWI
uniref:Uncharacterized protein n=1 Tax=Arundo donax TaxID=35708 RepID=A0A0A9FPB6_ARUDO